ncbi:hypothetical protein ACFLQ0_02775, partial [Nitrospinota bacterium]
SGVLTKPFEPENLLAEVGKALSWAAEEDTGGRDVESSAPPSETFEEELVEPAPITGDEEFLPGDEALDDTIAAEGAFNEQEALADLTVDLDTEGPLSEINEESELLEEAPDPHAGMDVEAALEEPTEFSDDQPAFEPPSMDMAMTAETPTDPQGESSPAEDEDPFKDMGLDEFLDEFDADAQKGAAEPTAPAAEESPLEALEGGESEAPPAEDEVDPTMLAIENTLADEFDSLVDDEPFLEEPAEIEVSPPDAPPAEVETDPAMLAAEDTLADQIDALSEKDSSSESEPPAEAGMETTEMDTSGEEELEAAEAEIAALQAEIAAEFEGAEGDIEESGLEHLADDQVRAAEEELASLEEELSIEEEEPAGVGPGAESEYGTSANEAAQLLEEAAFRETGTLEEEPEEAAEMAEDLGEAASLELPLPDEPAGVAQGEPELPEDDHFWEHLDIDSDFSGDAPPESPEIYAVPHEEEFAEEGGPPGDAAPVQESASAEVSMDADVQFEAELTSPLMGDAAAEPDEEIFPPEEEPEPEKVAPLIEQSLERTVEAIVPAILQRIESLVVAHLPDMVEKIVLREIEKIKRGE